MISLGHFIGAALVFAIAAQSQCSPVVGVSTLGIVPTPQRNLLLLHPAPPPDEPGRITGFLLNPLVSVDIEYLDEKVSTSQTLLEAFQPIV